MLKNGRFSDENILILRNYRSIEWDSRAKYACECGASKKRCVTKVKLFPDNFEITRRVGIADTRFCMIHYLHIHLPVYFDLPVQLANPSIWHNVFPNSFNGLRPEFSFRRYRIRFGDDRKVNHLKQCFRYLTCFPPIALMFRIPILPDWVTTLIPNLCWYPVFTVQ